MDAFLDQSGLSVGAVNVLKGMGGEWLVERVLTLTYDQLMARPACGKGKASEIIAFQEKCRSGEVWNDEVHEVAEEVLHPEQFQSLSEYVLAVAAKTCRMGSHAERIMAEYMGLLNVNAVRTLESMGAKLGGLTRERVRQISVKLEKGLFSERGKALFAEFVKCAEVIFSRNHFVLRERELVAGLNEVYPNWSGTTEFSALQLLEGCGIVIEKNASGRMAWMEGGAVKERYDIYLALLEDGGTPLENLTWESLNRDAGVLGLDGINEDEYRFIVQRVFDHYHHAKGTAKATLKNNLNTLIVSQI